MKLWYPEATVRLGPANKTWGKTDNIWGLVGHSSEGNIEGDMGVLDSQVRPRASWHLYNPRRGGMLQHYPFDDITWHTGSRRAWGLIGIESEGFEWEPLTVSQNNNLVDFFSWGLVEFEWPGLIRGTTLFEHNYFRDTGCPSGRILWDVLIRRTEKEEGNVIWILYEKDVAGPMWVTDLIQKYPIDEEQVPRYQYLGCKGPHGVPGDFLASIPYGYDPGLIVPNND